MPLNETQLKLLELNKGRTAPTPQQTREERVSRIAEKMGSGEFNVKSASNMRLFSPLRDVKETFSDIGASAKERATNAAESFKAKSEGKQGLLSTAFQTIGQVGGFIGDTAGNLIKGAAKVITPEPVEQAVGDTATKAVEAVVNTEPVQNFISYYNSLDEETQRNLGAALGIVEGASVIVGGAAAKEPLKQGFKQAKTKVKDFIATARKATPEAKTAGVLDDVVATDDILTKSQKLKNLKNREDGGLFDEGGYNPTVRNQEVASVVEQIPNYNIKDTFLNKSKAVEDYTKKVVDDFSTVIKNVKVVVPKKEIVSNIKQSIDEVAKTNILLSKADPVVKKYITSVQNAVKNVEGNPNGIWELRKQLDEVYKQSRGKNAFGDSKITVLDNVHTAARNALNKQLVKYVGDDATTFLRNYAALKEAATTLGLKALKEPRSKFGRLKARFPKISSVAGEAAQATPILGTTLRALKK